jgi:hypothetical protein
MEVEPMRYMLLGREDQEGLLVSLSNMPDVLEAMFAGLSPTDASLGAADGLSPVEQCWHLADLEQEGYGVRIRRLLTEDGPALPDFDGARIARERDYKSLSIADGMRAFRRARADNVAALRGLSRADWERFGTQEGVGRVGLCDVPVMMAEHDAAHREELEGWVEVYKNR